MRYDTITKINKKLSSAVAVIADRTAYDVRYSYRQLAGIAVVSMSIKLIFSFTLKSAFDAGNLLLIPVNFLAVRCSFVAKRYILQR